MKDVRYSLEKYSGRSSRFECPHCQKKTFTRYKDNHTNKYISEDTGRCNRIEKCGYHFTPKMYFGKNGFEPDDDHKPCQIPTQKPKKPSCIEQKYLRASLSNYHQNNFAIGLYEYFPKNIVNELLRKYFVGTAKGNKTVFWQVNRYGEVRSGKVMKYDSDTLKRNGYVNWVHKLLNLKDFHLKQIFFGGHLLVDLSKPVAIAEGEKNAIFGALFYSQYNWIAVGSIEMLNQTKLNALKGYQVTLFPDKGKAFQKWSRIAENACFDVKVNDVLENTNLLEGDDVADLVISIKNEQYGRSPEALIDKFCAANPAFESFMDKFDLVVSAFA